MSRPALVVLALLTLTSPARAATGPGPDAVPVFGPWRAYMSAALGVALDVPDDKAAAPAVVEEAFPHAARGVQFEHSLTVRGGRSRVEAWQDPDGLPLEAWVDAHLGFLVDARALAWSKAHTWAGSAVVIHQPTAPGMRARETTALRLGTWTLVVTCEGVDDAEGRALCDGLVASLRPARPEEVKP